MIHFIQNNHIKIQKSVSGKHTKKNKKKRV